jgi:hypothetical protein
MERQMPQGTTPEQLDPALQAKIEKALREWDDPASPTSKAIDRSLREWAEHVQPMLDAISESERLTESDMAIRINTRD